VKFDGYGASFQDATAPQVAHYLADALEGIPTRGPSMRRYGPTLAVEVGGRMAAWVGTATDGMIYVEGKGETSPALVEAIRKRFPAHGAPRVDVAQDRGGEGAFGTLQALIRARKGVKVKAGYIALPDDEDAGKTWVAGVRGGAAYVRLYEWGKHPDRVHLARPDVVRVELEARPHYARDKQAAARMSPAEVWGLTAWTHRVAEALVECPIPRYEAEVRRYTFHKTTLYLARTFRRHLEQMREDGEDFMRTCEAIWAEDDAASEKL
jgi:hypothetical protein